MAKLEHYSKLAEKALKGIALGNEPEALYIPVRYILDIGGKRLRPAMVLAACDICGGKLDEAVNPAIGIEVFHNFTLLHDDIMDNAPIRRGMPTVHEKWDANRAILSGDTMFAMAGQLMLKTRKEVIPEIMKLFLNTAVGVCEGQQLDMNFESEDVVSTQEYLEMIRLKTAILIAASLKTGAIIAGAKHDVAQKLYDFGIASGIAFQIQDDYLDTFGDEKTFGKQTGGDIRENKKTYLFTRAMEKADEPVKQQLSQLYSTNPGDDSKVQKVKEIFLSLGIDREARNLMDQYYDQSMKLLESLQKEIKHTEILEEFASKVIQREK